MAAVLIFTKMKPSSSKFDTVPHHLRLAITFIIILLILILTTCGMILWTQKAATVTTTGSNISRDDQIAASLRGPDNSVSDQQIKDTAKTLGTSKTYVSNDEIAKIAAQLH